MILPDSGSSEPRAVLERVDFLGFQYETLPGDDHGWITYHWACRSPLYGDDAGRPSPRTLMNLTMLRADDAASGPDHRFSLDEAAAAILSNRSFTAERLKDGLVAASLPNMFASIERDVRKRQAQAPQT